MQYFSSEFNQFFKELAANNHKEWFDANRKRYEKHVKEPFKTFVWDFIQEVSKYDPELMNESKDVIFRINRDIRFSKDKTPYKTNLSAAIMKGGRKNMAYAGYYFELGPEHVRFYMGLYQLTSQQLDAVRTFIAADPYHYIQTISNKEFHKAFGSIRGEKAIRLKKEYACVAEQVPTIYNKQFYAFAEFDASLVESNELFNKFIELFKIARPVSKMLNKAIQA